MEKLTNKEKSRLLIEETIDTLRNKSPKSAYVERIFCLEELFEKYGNEPSQPLKTGRAFLELVEKMSCPVMPQDILLGRVVDRVPTDEEEQRIQEIAVHKNGNSLLCDWGHCTFDWPMVMELGIPGLINRVERELAKADSEGYSQATRNYLEGNLCVIKGYKRYIERYAESAREFGNIEAAEVCDNIVAAPPRTFREAIQLLLFIEHVYSCYSSNSNATLSMGRVDDYLASYYEADIANGTLTREDAGYMIDDFNCKCAMILGRGEHQMNDGSSDTDTGWFRNPMYDSPTYAIIGGESNLREYGTNPLTKLFLERIQPRFENPVYVLRRKNDIDPEEWKLTCDKLRQNSTLLVYNDETMIPALEKAGIPHKDAVDYSIHGCNWIDIQGKGKGVNSVDGVIPPIIRRVLMKEDGSAADLKSIDDVYEAVGEIWRKRCSDDFGWHKKYLEERERDPSSMYHADVFFSDTIELKCSYSAAMKYSGVYTQVRNIATSADMLSALDTIVFGEDSKVSLDTMVKAIEADFEGYEDVLKLCNKAPKFGSDDDLSNYHASRLMTYLTDIAYEEAEKVNREGGYTVYPYCVTITDMWHRGEGAKLGATPDGRRKGKPLSENLSPMQGASYSVTSVLNSISNLPLDRICSGAANVRMPKNLVDGEEGLERLTQLLAAYFEDGGMQVQLSIADTQELRDAQLHPEKYPDLMVRITGYSAVFVDMCTSAQNEIIRRDEVS